MQNQQPNYDPSIFNQSEVEMARQVVLTPENGIPTQVRWESETPWLLNLIAKHIKPTGLVVDYGCGVGRIAAHLVEMNYPVIGVDTSASMRQHATSLIANERFVAMTPVMLDQLVGIGVKADCVLAIWMLQHCFDLEAEIERMPARKKEALVNELAGGAEAVPERGTVPIKTVKALKGR